MKVKELKEILERWSDEEEIKFTIDEADIQMVLDMPSRNIENDAIEVKPKLKENFVLKEAK